MKGNKGGCKISKREPGGCQNTQGEGASASVGEVCKFQTHLRNILRCFEDAFGDRFKEHQFSELFCVLRSNIFQRNEFLQNASKACLDMHRY